MLGTASQLNLLSIQIAVHFKNMHDLMIVCSVCIRNGGDKIQSAAFSCRENYLPDLFWLGILKAHPFVAQIPKETAHSFFHWHRRCKQISSIFKIGQTINCITWIYLHWPRKMSFKTECIARGLIDIAFLWFAGGIEIAIFQDWQNGIPGGSRRHWHRSQRLHSGSHATTIRCIAFPFD